MARPMVTCTSYFRCEQTQTDRLRDRQTETLIAIIRPPTGGKVTRWSIIYSPPASRDTHMKLEEFSKIHFLSRCSNVAHRTRQTETHRETHKSLHHMPWLCQLHNRGTFSDKSDNVGWTAYMWVPSSFTSWCITSSMLSSGTSSATVDWAEPPDRFRRWELVCRSAFTHDHQ